MSQYKEMVILIAEDDDGHSELIRSGLKKSGVCNEMSRFKNGQEIWDYMVRDDGTIKLDANRAYLLLLDINMPVMDGVEVLRRMKGNEYLKKTPVIMLTTTDDPREIELCYKLGCNAYITKPVDFGGLSEVLKRLGLFIQIVSV